MPIMSMRRVLLVLLMANLLVFAWWSGFLDDFINDVREPERVKQQVDPERLRIIPGERPKPATPKP
jgi:hypothetical protein